MVNAFKTTFLLTVLMFLFLVIGQFVGGQRGMSIAFIFACVMNVGAYWFSDKIVLRMNRQRSNLAVGNAITDRLPGNRSVFRPVYAHFMSTHVKQVWVRLADDDGTGGKRVQSVGWPVVLSTIQGLAQALCGASVNDIGIGRMEGNRLRLPVTGRPHLGGQTGTQKKRN